jgi:hypothetical protein
MRLFATACIALSLIAGSALAGDITAGSLKIENPWTREMPPGSKVGGGFLIITNSGDEADTLLSLTTPRADRGEVHEMSMNEGVMKMRELKDGLGIPAGGKVELKPGGYHVMLARVQSNSPSGRSAERCRPPI